MYWLAHLEGGPRRVNHTAVAIGDYIWSYGGYCSNEDYGMSSHVNFVFTLNRTDWTDIHHVFSHCLFPQEL